MLGYAVVFLCISFVVCEPEPRNLLDEAQKQLDQLSALIQSKVLTSNRTFQGILGDLQTYGNEAISSGDAILQDQSKKIDLDLSTIINLANSAKINITDCLVNNQQQLIDLPQKQILSLQSCVSGVFMQGSSIMRNGEEAVAIQQAKIQNLQAKLDICANGNIPCLAPIVTEIHLAGAVLPDVIDSEISKVADALQNLRRSIKNCQVTNIATFSSSAGEILQNIEDCINEKSDLAAGSTAV